MQRVTVYLKETIGFLDSKQEFLIHDDDRGVATVIDGMLQIANEGEYNTLIPIHNVLYAVTEPH